jgi:hypothetical protein
MWLAEVAVAILGSSVRFFILKLLKPKKMAGK